MSASFELDAPDHFTTGAVGPPGERVFYLQARQAGRLVSLKTEKEQMSTLAEYVSTLLARLAAAEGESPRDMALLEPVEPAWAVGSLGLGYDEDRDRVVIVASEAQEEGAEEAGASARFTITRAQARAFVERARAIVKAGRPTCPLCSGPMDPGGHICPRLNGHVAKS
jgi:uncharacterized repeat protein (TIGR03847 family)